MLTPLDREKTGELLGRLWARMHKSGDDQDISESYDTIKLLMDALSEKEGAYEALAEAHALCTSKLAQSEALRKNPLLPDPSKPE